MPRVVSKTITSGTDVSAEASYVNEKPASLVLDGTYTNTSFDLQAKIDGTWYDVYDVFGSKVNITVADGKHSLAADAFKDAEAVRVNGASNEAADRTVKFTFIGL